MLVFTLKKDKHGFVLQCIAFLINELLVNVWISILEWNIYV